MNDRPMNGECVREVAMVAAQVAKPLYDRPVKVMVVIYAEGEPTVLSHAGTDSDQDRVKAALLAALALLEKGKVPS